MSEGQTFGIVTYDALFKWVLSEDSIRPSFFHAFIPGIIVQSSERLDDHMNPLQELQLLRHLIHDKKTTSLVASLKESEPNVKVHIGDSYNENATQFLKSVLTHFDDIQYSFPKPRFDGTMDFVCKLDTGEYALIEMQIMPEENWDQRALAYVAALYGNQLKRGTSWMKVQKVIGLNILGGGKDNQAHWKDTPDQYVRHYKFQEQLNEEDPPRFLKGIDIIQYSLANAPEKVDTQEQRDWLRLLKDAHNMTEEDVQREIKTPAVLKAFKRAKLVSLPRDVKANYVDEDVVYQNLSGLMAEREAKGKAEGEAKGKAEGRAEKARQIARRMIRKGQTLEDVCETTELTMEIVQELAREVLKEGIPLSLGLKFK